MVQLALGAWNVWQILISILDQLYEEFKIGMGLELELKLKVVGSNKL